MKGIGTLERGGRLPLCPVEAGGRCRRFVIQRSEAEEIPWRDLVARVIVADAERRGLHLDRGELRAIIEMHDRYNALKRREGGR